MEAEACAACDWEIRSANSPQAAIQASSWRSRVNKIVSAGEAPLPVATERKTRIAASNLRNAERAGTFDNDDEDVAQFRVEVEAVLENSPESVTPNPPREESQAVTRGSDKPQFIGGTQLIATTQQVSAQVIFELLDLLQQWISEEEKEEASSAPSSKEPARSGRASPPPPTRVTRSGHSKAEAISLDAEEASSGTQGTEIIPKRSASDMKQVLDRIPNKILALAAFRCKASTRALKYMEAHLRSERQLWLARERPLYRKSLYEASSSNKRELPQDRMKRVILILDSPGQGMIKTDLEFLQRIYAELEEPDGMSGIAALRKETSLQENIRDYESAGEWAEALTCYEQALQMDPQNLDHHIGLLGCLTSLGHLSTAVTHVRGAIAQVTPSEDRSTSAPKSILATIGTGNNRTLSALSAFGVQAAWRLSRWDLLEEFLSVGPEPSFEVQVGRILLSLHNGDHATFQEQLQRARLEVMNPLAASSSSYRRAHRYFLQLHMLTEIEHMKEVCGQLLAAATPAAPMLSDMMDSATVAASSSLQSAIRLRATAGPTESAMLANWTSRLNRAEHSFRIREPLLSLRRVLLLRSGLEAEAGQCWLSFAKEARAAHQFDTAASALLHCMRLNVPTTMVERAKLARAKGDLHTALLYVEKALPTKDYTNTKPTTDEAKIRQRTLTKPVLLLGSWALESGAKASTEAIKYIRAAIDRQPQWEKAYYLLGKYYDSLAIKEGAMESKTPAEISSRSRAQSRLQTQAKCFGYVVINFANALIHGNQYLFETLPRILTLCFNYPSVMKEYDNYMREQSAQSSGGGSTSSSSNAASSSTTSGRGSSTNSSSRSSSNSGSNSPSRNGQQPQKDKLEGGFVAQLIAKLAPFQLLTTLPQIISRMCHEDPFVAEFINCIIVKVLVAYPQQTLWGLASSIRSIDQRRKDRAQAAVVEAQKRLPESLVLINKTLRIFDGLHSVCTHDVKKPEKYSLNVKFPYLSKLVPLPLIVPIQSSLTVTLPAHVKNALVAPQRLDSSSPIFKDHRAFPDNLPTIASFVDEVEVLRSKERPCKLSIVGSDGVTYIFLCKRETKSDMRKNSRMMEFNTVVNRLLKKNPESRQRKLHLRTFSVIPLMEETGLIEWVNDTVSLRSVVDGLHRKQGIRNSLQELRDRYDAAKAEKNVTAQEAELKFFFEVSQESPPVLHKWFLTKCAEPTQWFETRLNYARSTAAWSMVGHVVGLGDRHGENLLLDETNGELIHVDFDCMFDKGKTLEKPECVPFRLTCNIIDGFGITGHSGLFRRSCEVTMSVLRNNKDSLLCVLETFVHDPLVEWKDKHDGKPKADIMTMVNGRLSGQEAPLDSSRSDVGNKVSLSVQGQVHELIKQATDPLKLSQMFIGWMPWL